MVLRRILLIEDDQDIQDALKESLELEGYDAYVASDGAEGLALLESGLSPELILLDLMMPGVDGREFLFRIRHTAYASIPVLVLTASRESLPDGARKLIRKPFSLDHLVGEIEGIFRRHDRALRSVPTLGAVSAEAL